MPSDLFLVEQAKFKVEFAFTKDVKLFSTTNTVKMKEILHVVHNQLKVEFAFLIWNLERARLVAFKEHGGSWQR